MTKQPHINALYTSKDSVTHSELMKDIYVKSETLAGLDKNLIIIGEIGTGKKRLGRFIHQRSKRKDHPFHCFYCVDVDESKYKDAFWEHVEMEGSHIILSYDVIEKASGGVLYLDQFSELKTELMTDIIESFFQGCRQLFRFNTAMTPRLVISLNAETYQKFSKTPAWEHLLSLLDPFVIMVPPLRERREDITGLIQYFLNECRAMRVEWRNLRISTTATDMCKNYKWPGNIRQLKNAIVQGAVLSNGETIEVHHLPFSLNWKLPYTVGKD
jgi:DNA-binding NtrC family response regulator